MERGYQLEVIPRARVMIVDAQAIGAGRHMSHGFVALDVTRARRIIRRHAQATGEALSFTAFVIACAARAAAEHKRVNAYRNWRNRLVMFDDVDVATMVEAETDAVAVAHVVRAANRKSVLEIHREIRAVQARPASSPQHPGRLMRLSLYLPGALRRSLLRLVRRFPRLLKRMAGTVAVTAVGMFGGKGGGWALPIVPLHTVCLTIGGIEERPALEDGRIAAHELLDLTASVDHDVVDGAPAARFVRRLRELIEAADGLPVA